MINTLEGILNALILIGKQDKVEYQIQENQIRITSVKQNILFNDKFELRISKVELKNDVVDIAIKIKGEVSEITGMNIPILFDMLTTARLLNKQVKERIIIFSGFNEEDSDADMALALLQCRTDAKNWTELTNLISVRSEKKSIVFELEVALDDPQFQAFLHYVLFQKTAIANYKKLGVKSLVFISNVTNLYEELTIGQLEKMKKH